MTETKHTPTPWRVVPHTGTRIPDKIFMIVGASELVCGDDGICVPDNMNDRSFVEDEANMHHIVKCVNMHDDLVEAITSVVMASEQWNYKKDIDAFNALSAAVDLCNEALKKAGAL